MTTLLLLLQYYLVIGLATWGIVVLLLHSLGLVVRVTTASVIGWTMVVVGWPFVVQWFVNSLLEAISEATKRIHGDDEGGDDDGDSDGGCYP